MFKMTFSNIVFVPLWVRRDKVRFGEGKLIKIRVGKDAITTSDIM